MSGRRIGDVIGNGPIEQDASSTLALLHGIIAEVEDVFYDAGRKALTEAQKACLLDRARFAEAREMIEDFRDSHWISSTLAGRLIRQHAEHHGAESDRVSSWPK